MPGRTLDAIIQEAMAIKEMVIARQRWHIEDLQAQLGEARDKLAASNALLVKIQEAQPNEARSDE